MNILKIKPGIVVIALYFITEGVGHSYLLVNSWIYKKIAIEPILILIPIICFVSGVGLFLQKGWGRNFALLSAFYYGSIEILELTSYLSTKPSSTVLLKGSIHIAIQACILYYMLRKSTKDAFQQSPLSLGLIGGFFMFYKFFQHSGNAIIDYIWDIMSVVGFFILFKAGKQFRKSIEGKTNE